jgi:hypothetical protein
MECEHMNLAKNELIHHVRGHFKLDLQREIFDAAVESFDHEDGPLRLGNFAFALRELGRIWLEQLAPKEKIRACKWFEQYTDLREEDGVTRAQRAKYAVQGELHDEFVLEDLHIDVQSTVKECLALLDELCKYGHNMAGSFDISGKRADLEALRALGTFDQLSGLIQERHDSLLSSAADFSKETISLECGLYDEVDEGLDALFDEADEEFDRLSTHFSGGDVHLDSLAILSLDPDRILYQGRGRVYARLRYGADSNVALDKGEAIHDIYPFECSFESDARCLYPAFVPRSMKIDTDSSHDDGQG